MLVIIKFCSLYIQLILLITYYDSHNSLMYEAAFLRCQKHERSLRFSYTFNNPTVRKSYWTFFQDVT